MTRHVLTHKCHGVGDLFENTRAPVNVQEALGDVGTIIARLLKWGGEVTLRGGMSSGMWEGLKSHQLQTVNIDR